MSFKGHVMKGLVVLDQPLPLPDGTPVVVEPMATVSGDFWRSYSLDELAQQQGVSTPRSLNELLGGWPADELNDDFEEAFQHWRECERENHP
jgi:hypothetical protein